jgi:predicted TIM-barrel fold metal-dependent hydrolase
VQKLDIFNHFFPAEYCKRYITSGLKDIGKRVQNVPTIADLDARFRVMDEFGPEYVQFLTLPAPTLEGIAEPDRSPELAACANDGLAELCSRYPERFVGFGASLPMNNPDAAVKEIGRAVDQLGARAVQIYTNVRGKRLDLPEFYPIFEECARRDLTILMHPARGAETPDYITEKKSHYEIWWTFGWPYETSAAMAHVVFSGILDKLPNLKIVTHHMGGMIPYFEGRVGYGWDVLGSRTSDEDYVSLRQGMDGRPIDYFRKFYADTALFGGMGATKCGLTFFGVDNVVFASDVPFEPAPGLYIRETIRCVNALEITDVQRAQIYSGNAKRLLGL